MAACTPAFLQDPACCMAGIGDSPTAGCTACRRQSLPVGNFRGHAMQRLPDAASGKTRMRKIAYQSGKAMHEHAADSWHHECMQVSQDEEKLQKARLEVKRGLPLQDLSGNKGFPEDARTQAQVRHPKTGCKL